MPSLRLASQAAGRGGNIQRAQPKLRIEDVAHQNEFVGQRRLLQLRQTGSHGFWPADHGGREEISNAGAFLRMQPGHEILHWRRQATAVAVQDAEHALMDAAGQELGFRVGRAATNGTPIIT